MTNYEFYRDRLITTLACNSDPGCAVIKELIGEKCEDEPDCKMCEKKLDAWLREEYVESGVDWRKVEPGAFVNVKFGDGLRIKGLTFIGYYKGCVYAAFNDELTATGYHAPNVELYEEEV